MRSGDGDHPGQHGETPSLLKYTHKKKPGVVVCTCTPSYSGGQEAEAGELLEPWKQRLPVSLGRATAL